MGETQTALMRADVGVFVRQRLDRLAGTVWRGHGRRYNALDDGGSRVMSARYHQAINAFPPDDVWPALYTGLDLAVSLAEIMRARPTSHPRDVRFTELMVELGAVADCRDLEALGIDSVRLFADFDYSVGHALARVVRAAGGEGMLVPSASLLGDNLVIFPDLLRTGTSMGVVRSVDPNLTKDRGWIE